MIQDVNIGAYAGVYQDAGLYSRNLHALLGECKILLDFSNQRSFPGVGSEINDISKNLTQCYTVGNPSYSDSKAAMHFNGSTDWLNLFACDAILKGSYSIVFTYRNSPGSPTFQFLLLNGVGTVNGGQLNYSIRKIGGQIYWYISDGINRDEIATVNTTINWQTVAFIFRAGQQIEVYTDGKLAYQAATTIQGYSGNRNQLAFSGIAAGGGTQFFNGDLAALQIFDRDISAEEVNRITGHYKVFYP